MLKLLHFSHLMWRVNSLEKDPDAGKDWGRKEKGAKEDKVVGWHHWLNGYEFEQTLGDGDGQGSLVCCSPWGHKESDVTQWPNNNNIITIIKFSFFSIIFGTSIIWVLNISFWSSLYGSNFHLLELFYLQSGLSFSFLLEKTGRFFFEKTNIFKGKINRMLLVFGKIPWWNGLISTWSLYAEVYQLQSFAKAQEILHY